MKRNPIVNAASLLACLALTAGVTGCSVHVDKDANGKEKNVQIDTPFGRIHVNTDKTTAADLGLPVYPGAQLVKDSDNPKSADVHMGFGEWELRVRAVSYETPDKQDEVAAFYKKALGRYGNVISCQDGKAIGTPVTTKEGLGCYDNSHVNVNAGTDGHSYGYHSTGAGLELKAGSERHQHIVGFESSAPGGTRFALVALDLPSEVNDNEGRSD